MNRLLLSYFFVNKFVNLFHPQFISQSGLSDFPIYPSSQFTLSHRVWAITTHCQVGSG